MTKKNRKRNRKKKQLLAGGESNYPSRCPVCASKTILRVSRRTKQKFVGCLGFPGCNWSYNLNTNIIVPKYIPPSLPKAEVGEMEKYYYELQLLCDVGDEMARDEMDKLEKRFSIVYV